MAQGVRKASDQPGETVKRAGEGERPTKEAGAGLSLDKDILNETLNKRHDYL